MLVTIFRDNDSVSIEETVGFVTWEEKGVVGIG